MRRRSAWAMVLMAAFACSGDRPGAYAPEAPKPLVNWMSATVDGVSFNAVNTTVHQDGDYLVVTGLAWVGLEDQMIIRLTLRTDVGPAPQVVSPDGSLTADVTFRPWYDESQNWTAGGSSGSGTAVLTAPASDRVTGTFSFTAQALTAETSPRQARVTNGTFGVQIR